MSTSGHKKQSKLDALDALAKEWADYTFGEVDVLPVGNKVSFYCPACGENSDIEFCGLFPGAINITCPNCETVFDVSMEFYEVECPAKKEG